MGYNKKKKVALIGCGLIGQSWAVGFLSAGFRVSLFDPTKGVTENAKEKITAKLSDLQNHGLISKRKISDYLNQIYLAPSISKAVEDCVYVQESGPENLDIKKELTQNIDNATSENIPIASSTSGIPTSLYANEVE